MEKIKMEDIVNYCKQYGFIFQGSEIYGGLSNTWDYGPLGKELKENVRRAWWKKFIQENPYNYGLDAAILMNPEVWVASGHVTNFNDPLIDCKKCKSRHRADKLIEEFTKGEETGDGWENEKIESFIKDNHIVCPKCGSEDFTPIRKFNLLFETHQGVTEDTKNKVYLRGETAQGIFVNFLNVQRSMRAKVPFGIGQTGKSFRNEITNTFEGYVAGVQNMFNYIVKNYVKEKLPERFEEIDKKLKCNEDSSLIPEHRKKISVVVPVIEVDEKIEVETEIVEPEYEVKQEGTRKSMVSKELTEIYGGETSPKKEPEEKEDDGMVEGLSKEILELYGIDVAGDEE